MTYGEALAWTVVIVGFAAVGAVFIYILADSVGRQTMLYLFGPIIGFFALCALIAIPVWLLT